MKEWHSVCFAVRMHTTACELKYTALLAAVQSVDKGVDLESAVRDVLRLLSEQLPMQRALVTLNAATAGRGVRVSLGMADEEWVDAGFDADAVNAIIRTNEAYCLLVGGNELVFVGDHDLFRVNRSDIAFVGVPIIVDAKPVGTLSVDRLFTDDMIVGEDVGFLKEIALLVSRFVTLSGRICEQEDGLRRENICLLRQIPRKDKERSLVGRSSAIGEVQRQVEKAAPSRATALLLGESGVGKDHIARMIHNISGRKDCPFIKVNCASIPGELLESELFGSGDAVVDREGFTTSSRFEEADGGTIFLEEIDGLPMGLQAKLLHVLQEKELGRSCVGTIRPIDVRVLVGTNRDLGDLVEYGEFRLDLYYRLNVLPIRIPPLRDRKQDISVLLTHFIEMNGEEYGRTLCFTSSALDALIQYDWPGNVREMKNFVERLFIMSDVDRINLESLKTYLAPSVVSPSQTPVPLSEEPCRFSSLQEFERNEVLAALERNGWIQYKAADALGLSARQMGYRVKKYGLESMITEGRAKARRQRDAHI